MKCVQMSTVFTVNCSLSPKAFVDVLLTLVGFSNLRVLLSISTMDSVFSLAVITNVRVHFKNII